ncbi:hypothetical protein ABH19_02745 [Leptospirillum sp. Group II 'CF-1']|nr:hypothetical protein ABH19_02745 [Leptospirillum sp. Group II 'CF-1']
MPSPSDANLEEDRGPSGLDIQAFGATELRREIEREKPIPEKGPPASSIQAESFPLWFCKTSPHFPAVESKVLRSSGIPEKDEEKQDRRTA